MTYDRRDVIDSTRRLSRPNGKALPRDPFEPPRQALVLAEHLMTDPHWTVYQQVLQDARNRTEAVAKRALEALANPMTVTVEDLMRLKVTLAEARGMVAAFDAAIALPKQLKGNAEAAIQALLARFPGTGGGDNGSAP